MKHRLLGLHVFILKYLTHFRRRLSYIANMQALKPHTRIGKQWRLYTLVPSALQLPQAFVDK